MRGEKEPKTTMKHGIHYNLGMSEYHSWKLDKANLKAGPISCSMLKDFAPNPYAWLKAPERKATAAMNTGSLFDLALTDPDAMSETLVVSPFDSMRTNKAKEWRDEQLANGKLIVDEADIETATLAAQRVREHEIAGSIMQKAQCQVGVVGEVNGIPAKCLLDIEPSPGGDWEEHLFDYKTTSGGLDDESIRKTISNFRYHWQASFYRSLKNKVDDARHCEHFGFIFQDVNTLEVRVVVLDQDDLLLGNRCITKTLCEFVKCSERGIHSRYTSSVSNIKVMPYQAMNEEEWLESEF